MSSTVYLPFICTKHAYNLILNAVVQWGKEWVAGTNCQLDLRGLRISVASKQGLIHQGCPLWGGRGDCADLRYAKLSGAVAAQFTPFDHQQPSVNHISATPALNICDKSTSQRDSWDTALTQKQLTSQQHTAAENAAVSAPSDVSSQSSKPVSDRLGTTAALLRRPTGKNSTLSAGAATGSNMMY